MTKMPPYLKPGDVIGILAPAGFMAYDRMQPCIKALQEWGYRVTTGTTTQSLSQNYFSGTDEERLADLQALLDDRFVKAILCARGGYGMSRIIDRLNFKKFRKNPKWIIGFSDITVLHSHLYAAYKIASLHSPMAAAFCSEDPDDQYVLSLKHALEGKPMNYSCEAHEFNRLGTATGCLVGGNLSILTHLIGTPSDVNMKNKILFLEDVGEYLYHIDRMLMHLKRAGKFDKIEGVVIGGFTDMKDTERPYGKSILELINDQIKPLDIPYCFGFPVSHDKENYALKIGVKCELTIHQDVVTLKELTGE